MAKAEADGQQVNIPALRRARDGVTKSSISGALLDLRSGHEDGR